MHIIVKIINIIMQYAVLMELLYYYQNGDVK